MSEYQEAIEEGYSKGCPPSAFAIDSEIAEKDPCPECGGKMQFKPVMMPDSYRAFSICEDCQYEFEF